jgi:hypothetical protein
MQAAAAGTGGKARQAQAMVSVLVDPVAAAESVAAHWADSCPFGQPSAADGAVRTIDSAGLVTIGDKSGNVAVAAARAELSVSAEAEGGAVAGRVGPVRAPPESSSSRSSRCSDPESPSATMSVVEGSLADTAASGGARHELVVGGAPFVERRLTLEQLTSWRLERDPRLRRAVRFATLEALCGGVSMQARRFRRVLVGPSTIHEAGYGLFAGEPIDKGELVQEYVGEVVQQMEAERRGSIYDIVNRSYLFDLNDECTVDATRKGNKMRFANHSKDPNCVAKKLVVNGTHRIGIFAKRRIQAHQELFFDYRYDKEIVHASRRQAAAAVAWFKDGKMAGKVHTATRSNRKLGSKAGSNGADAVDAALAAVAEGDAEGATDSSSVA